MQTPLRTCPSELETPSAEEQSSHSQWAEGGFASSTSLSIGKPKAMLFLLMRNGWERTVRTLLSSPPPTLLSEQLSFEAKNTRSADELLRLNSPPLPSYMTSGHVNPPLHAPAPATAKGLAIPCGIAAPGPRESTPKFWFSLLPLLSD